MIYNSWLSQLEIISNLIILQMKFLEILAKCL